MKIIDDPQGLRPVKGMEGFSVFPSILPTDINRPSNVSEKDFLVRFTEAVTHDNLIDRFYKESEKKLFAAALRRFLGRDSIESDFQKINLVRTPDLPAEKSIVCYNGKRIGVVEMDLSSDGYIQIIVFKFTYGPI